MALPIDHVAASGSSTRTSSRERSDRCAGARRAVSAMRRALRLDQVAEAAQRPDRRAAADELLAQPRDERLERVGAEVVVEARQLVGEHLLADDASRRRHQLDEDVVLARGELELALRVAVADDEEAADVALEAQPSDLGDIAGAVDAARERAQARLELAELEGLAEIVVGAGVEAGDALLDAVARGEHEHGGAVAAR